MFHVSALQNLPLASPTGQLLDDQCRCCAACGNYVIDPGEECDDGNPFSGDGCSSSCMLEDPNIWLCSNGTGGLGPTTCCRSYLNPVTNSKVCSCEGQASDSSRYTISPICQKVDVDECATGQNNCNANAVCTNLNGAIASATSGFQCVCPPGLVGDGVTECQLYAYVTKFVMQNPGVTAASFNVDQFKTLLLQTGAVPANTPPERIHVEVKDNASGASARRSMFNVQKKVQQLKSGSRHLLQTSSTTGVTITVSVYSLTAEDQNMVAASINTAAVQTQGYQTVVQPYKVSSDTEVSNDPISTVAGGFQVVSVQYNDTDSRCAAAAAHCFALKPAGDAAACC